MARRFRKKRNWRKRIHPQKSVIVYGPHGRAAHIYEPHLNYVEPNRPMTSLEAAVCIVRWVSSVVLSIIALMIVEAITHH